MRKLFAVCLLPLMLSNCAVLAVGAVTETGVSAVEERSFGTKLDDQVIYAAVNDQFMKSGNDNLTIAVTVNVRHARVMLTGNVASQEMAQLAVASAWKAKGVKEVINELIVNPDSTYGAAANDILVKKNLIARLLITKDVWRINYSIDVVAGNAYLLGVVKDRAELDRVLNVARTTKGVKRVVSHLQIAGEATDSNPAAAPTPEVMESPVSPAVQQSPTDGTISTEDIDSNDLSAPTSNAPQPSSPTAPRWR